MKKFCIPLREHAANVINFENKKMIPFTKKEPKLNQDATACYIYGERFSKKFVKDSNSRKVRDHCHFKDKYRDAAHSICNSRFNVPNEIPIVFHVRSNYDYKFIIKELAKEFEGKSEYLGEITEKYKTFPFLIEKEIGKVNKDGHENIITFPTK